MIEAFLLLVEFVLFGLLLLSVGSKAKPGQANDLGLFSYRDSPTTAARAMAQADKGNRNA